MSKLTKMAAAIGMAVSSGGGSGGGSSTSSDTVFSARPYVGNGTTNAITTGVDLTTVSVASDSYGVATVVQTSFGGADGSWYSCVNNVLTKLGVGGWQITFTAQTGISKMDGAADASGNVYVAYSDRDTGGGNYFYVVVCKINSSGAIVWRKRHQFASNSQTLYAMAIDGSDMYYIAQGADIITAYVVKVNGTDGSAVWTRSFTSAGQMQLFDIAYNPVTAKICVCGVANDLVVTNPVSFISSLNPATGVATADGNWYYGDSSAQSIAVSTAGDLYMISNTSGSQKFHITRHNPTTLALVWQRIFNGAAANSAVPWTASIGAGTLVSVRIYNAIPTEQYFTFNASGTLLNSAISSGTGYGGAPNVAQVTVNGGKVMTGKGSNAVRWAETDVSGSNHPMGSTATMTVAVDTNFISQNPSRSASTVASPAVTAQNFAVSSAATNYTWTSTVTSASGGGMVWFKNRSRNNTSHQLTDTINGVGNRFATDTNAIQTSDGSGPSFNANGFTFTAAGGFVSNTTNDKYGSWTFKRATKFFDIVNYSGNGVNSRNINHNLGVAPGLILLKNNSNPTDWKVLFKITGGSYANLVFNTTVGSNDGSVLTNGYCSGASSTTFTVNAASGVMDAVNATGGNYTAYLFAHDPDTTNGIIQCGTFTSNAGGKTVALGWEPQFVLFKCTSAASDWQLVDAQRGWQTDRSNKTVALQPNSSLAESATGLIGPDATGFTHSNGQSGDTYFYMAIRRSTKIPTAGSQVFNTILNTGNSVAKNITGVGFSPDMVLSRYRSGSVPYGAAIFDRARGTALPLNIFSNAPEDLQFSDTLTDFSQPDGFAVGAEANSAYLNRSGDNFVAWCFKRAKGFLDVVPYIGLGGSTSKFAHNLGVPPELILVRRRDSGTDAASFNSDFYAAVKKSDGNGAWLDMSSSGATIATDSWAITAYGLNDAAGFNPWGVTLRGGTGIVGNVASAKYIAYLFASLAGVSKIGSYVGAGGTKNINCGFSNGARFVMIKRVDAVGSWYVWDTVRGITVSANDPYAVLESTGTENTTANSIEPLSSGFSVLQNATTALNVSGIDSWSSKTGLPAVKFYGLATNGTTIVTVGEAGNIWTSGNAGTSWIQRTNPLGTPVMNGVCYANGMFMAVGANGGIITSVDGSSWAIVGAGTFTTESLQCVAYGSGVWVVAGTAAALAWSSDGVSFTKITSVVASGSSIIYGNGVFLLAGLGRQTGVSATGKAGSWTAGSSPAGVNNVVPSRVGFGNGQFMIGADWDGATYTPIAYGTDGLTWTLADSTFNGNYVESFVFYDGTWLATGTSGQMAYSTNGGANWTAITPANNTFVNSWIWASTVYNGQFMAVGDQGHFAVNQASQYVYLAIA